MKVYTYKTGGKAIFINNEKTVIDNQAALMLENFEGIIENDHPDTRFPVAASTLKVVEHCKNFDIEEINKEINSIKINALILRKKGSEEIRGMKLNQNGEEVDTSIFDLSQVYQQLNKKIRL